MCANQILSEDLFNLLLYSNQLELYEQNKPGINNSFIKRELRNKFITENQNSTISTYESKLLNLPEVVLDKILKIFPSSCLLSIAIAYPTLRNKCRQQIIRNSDLTLIVDHFSYDELSTLSRILGNRFKRLKIQSERFLSLKNSLSDMTNFKELETNFNNNQLHKVLEEAVDRYKESISISGEFNEYNCFYQYLSYCRLLKIQNYSNKQVEVFSILDLFSEWNRPMEFLSYLYLENFTLSYMGFQKLCEGSPKLRELNLIKIKGLTDSCLSIGLGLVKDLNVLRLENLEGPFYTIVYKFVADVPNTKLPNIKKLTIRAHKSTLDQSEKMNELRSNFKNIMAYPNIVLELNF